MKYEYKADRYSSHAKILEIIRKKKKNTKILDVGCASGYLGKQLGKKHHLVGIEIDRAAANKAKPFYQKIILADLDGQTVRLKEKFDIIIFGDILEHLKNAETVLKMFTTRLKKNGIIIISLPNIALVVFRLKHFFGNFDYADTKGTINYQGKGPMDKTHVHFYTLKTAKQFIRGAGLRIRKFYTIPVPLPLVHSWFQEGRLLYPLHIVSNSVTQLWKKFFGYQFVFVATLDNVDR